jgi:hypothetical protein
MTMLFNIIDCAAAAAYVIWTTKHPEWNQQEELQAQTVPQGTRMSTGRNGTTSASRKSTGNAKAREDGIQSAWPTNRSSGHCSRPSSSPTTVQATSLSALCSI